MLSYNMTIFGCQIDRIEYFHIQFSFLRLLTTYLGKKTLSRKCQFIGQSIQKKLMCVIYCLMNACPCARARVCTHALVTSCQAYPDVGLILRIILSFHHSVLFPMYLTIRTQQLKSVLKMFFRGTKKHPRVTKRREKPNIFYSKSTDALIFLILLLHNQLTQIIDKIIVK